ncbi:MULTISPECIES: DUF6701 domain-containing protein [Marinobacter]|uniref:DUF6701 domain-containing protein n=1 Tax=Marinobacter TaxID=2742 RepID=UPI00124781EB|nr:MULTISPECIES: DUF6701 domain-containing protein [Marinobacter]MBL3558346.1 MshQ-like protein [Marinobacter sp. JB05H06]
MKTIREFVAILTVLVIGCVVSPSVWAASCSNVFGAPDGINENLQASGNTLDLSGIAFADNPWPASGTTLTSGDYFFRGTNLDNGYQLNVAAGAQVRVFVSGSLTTGNNIGFNPTGGSDQFLLVVDGSLSMGNNARIRGLVYASGAMTLGNNANLRGGLAAGGSISTGNQDPVADYSGVGAGLLAGLCEAPVDLSANGDSIGPVSVAVGDNVLLSVTGQECPPEGVWYSYRVWEDRWVIDGEQREAFNTASLCDRSPVTRTVTFDEPGQYTVSFQSLYRECIYLFGCENTQRLLGSDEIVIEVVDPAGELACFVDEFASGLSADDWVTSVASGSFNPSVVGSRLRMTEAVSNQSTAATLQREIPGADNLVILEFDYYAYGGSGADGLAVVLSDASITPQPGSFGGSLGYAQRNNGDPGFAGGWIGIGLDEFGNFSNPTEGRQGGPGFRRDAVAIRGAYQGGYRYLRGTGTLATGIDQPGNNDPSAHRYRIIVDSRNVGEAVVSVERDTTGTGNSFQELIAPFDALNETGQPDVPENFLLSLTGSTGGSTNIHELDNIELCALQLNPVGDQVDHFEIIHDGVALTCQPETVTIRACADENCDQLFTDPVQATLAPSEGWQGGNVVNLAGGFGEATLQNTIAGEVTLEVIGSQPTTRPQAVTLCQAGGGGLSSANCMLEFFDSGLSFDVPDLTSHRPSGPVEVRAVRRDDATQACVPAFENVERPVQFWSTYIDPDETNRPASRVLSLNGEEVSGDSGAPTTINLNFGAGGIAEIDVRYPDAGQMQLGGRYLGSAATEDEGLVMPGSDQFVSVPAGLCVRTDGECAAGDASCPPFAKAGEEFDLSITAVGWQSDGDANLCEGNPVTPNFRLLDVPLSSSVVAPPGGAHGALSPTSYTHTRSADATETVNARVSEVGAFEFLATPVDGGYLGKTVPQGISAAAGRFYPDRFSVTVDPGALSAECSEATPFTYTGQDIKWSLVPSLEIEPLSMQGTRTVNYTAAGFLRLSATGVSRATPLADSTALNRNGDPLTVITNVSDGDLNEIIGEPGLLQFDYAGNDTIRYDKLPEARVEPVDPDLEYIVTDIVDADGVSGADAPYPFTPAADFDVRYGRLTMDNVYGPENIPELLMPFRLEYWNGSRFVVNTADSCTAWNTTDISSPAEHHTLAADAGTFSSGEAGPLSLQPAGSQGTDTLTWAVETWLTDDVDEDGSLDNPSALATFGVYRGHDRVIYWRER